MRGRAAVSLLCLSVLSLPVVGQCNLAPVYSAQFRTSILDIAIDNNDLWAATSYGISLYDRRIDPPKLVASIPAPGITRVVRAANGTIYAGSGSSVVLICNRAITKKKEGGGPGTERR